MTLAINDVRPWRQYVATAGQTTFDVPFEFFSAPDLVVFRNDILLQYTLSPATADEFSVSGAGVDGGGALTLGAGADLADLITVFRDMAVARVTDFPLSGPFQIEALNIELSRLTAMVQQVADGLNYRALLIPANDVIDDLDLLPPAGERAGLWLRFGLDGQPEVVPASELQGYLDAAASAAASAAADAAADAATVEAAASAAAAAASAAEAAAAVTDAETAAATAAAAANTAWAGSLDATIRAGMVFENIFDKARVTPNSGVNPTTGVVAGAGGYWASDFIRVKPGETISTKTALYGAGAYGRAFYDANQAFVSGSNAAVAADGNFTVPATASISFVRVMGANATLDSAHLVHGSTAPTSLRAFEHIDTFTHRGRFIDRVDDYFAHTPNLYNKAGATSGRYLNTSTGAYITNAAYFTTNWMPVSPDASYTFNSSTAGGTGYVWRDAAGTFISGGSAIYGTAIVAPASAAWLEAAFQITANNVPTGAATHILSALMIWEGTAFPQTFKGHGYADPEGASREAVKVTAGHKTKLNLYRQADALNGQLLNNDGTLSANASYMTTGFIPVRPGYGLAASSDFAPGSGYSWHWYDRDLNHIGQCASNPTANTTSGSADLVVTAYNATSAPLTKGQRITGSGIPAGAYITAVPSTPLGTYTMSANATATATGVAITATGVINRIPVFPPYGAAFGRCSANATRYDDLVISYETWTGGLAIVAGSVGQYSAPGFIGDRDLERMLPWAGKTMACLGDSIMQDGTGNNYFQGWLESYTRANATVWAAVSGRLTSQLLNGAPGGTYARGTASAWGAGSEADYTNVALTVSNAGTNDFGLFSGGAYITSMTPLGAVGDDAADATLHGYLYDIFVNKLQNQNKSMRIALLTPLPRFEDSAAWTNLPGNPQNANGVKLSQYADAIIDFGAAYSIPVLDLFRRSGINMANRTTFLSDGLHLNAAGYAKIVPFVGRWLNTL